MGLSKCKQPVAELGDNRESQTLCKLGILASHSKSPEMSPTVNKVISWIIVTALVSPTQAKASPEPVMADIARAMIPQASPCYHLFPLHYSIGGALARIFAPRTLETHFNSCFPQKRPLIIH